MNTRIKLAIGPAPVALALADNNKPLSSDAAAPGAGEFFPNSRRVNANAVHINGPATGPSPPEPAPNHDNNPRPNPDTAPEDALVNTGASTAAAVAAADGVAKATAAADAAGAVAMTGAAGLAAAGLVTSNDVEEGDDAGEDASLCADLLVPVPPEDEDAAGEEDVASSDALDWLRRAGMSAADDPRPPRDRGAGTEMALSDEEPTSGPAVAVLLLAAESPPRAPRVPRAVRGDVDFDAPPDDEDDESEAEPADPVVSANATGIETTAEPTPKATARAPTRPT